MKRLMSRHELALARFVDDGVGRYMNLAVTDKHTEVTNGHYMIQVAAPQRYPADEYPCAPKGTIAKSKRVKRGNVCYLSPDAAASILKSLPKKPNVPVLGHALIVADDKLTQLASTDLSGWNVKTNVASGEKWPEMKTITPRKRPKAYAGFSVEYVAELFTYLKSAGAKVARFDCYGPDKPVRITGTLEDGAAVTMLLMPMRCEEPKKKERKVAVAVEVETEHPDGCEAPGEPAAGDTPTGDTVAP